MGTISDKGIIVATNGCFDILHPGHIELLKAARHFGDTLVVAINSDESVKRLKGNARPIMPLSARMTILRSLWFVDHVVPFDEDTPEELYSALKPDVIVKGSEYKDKTIAGSEHCKKVEMVEMVSDWSTTGIIERVKNA